MLTTLRRPLRTAWRRLISMRTALILLFLLALASVPGSLLPQRNLNPAKVQAYLATHGAWGRFLKSIGGFDVFGSVWFAAIYLLLFASLIGCLIPRITVYAKALRAKPIKAPRNLGWLADNDRFTSTLTPDDAAAKAVSELKPRWRTVIRPEESGAIAVSAEKGYSREAGNLLFHVALLASLLFIAIGRLFHYEGSIVLTEGSSFCNVLPAYDSFKAGRSVDKGALAPFCIDKLNAFSASYRDDGSPASFKADVTYSLGLDGQPRHDLITVNHPLRIMGDRVYLISHGYSPSVTVKRPDGRILHETAAFLPQDPNLTSEGAFQIQGPGDGHDIGIEGLFAPTPVEHSKGVITSDSPIATDPVLAIFAYVGQLNPGGLPQSVYTLDQGQKDSGKLKKVGAKSLRVGDSLTLPDATVITFDGYKQWASMQVSHDPTQTYLLISAVLMVTGLLGSLAIRRRRVWLRLSSDESGSRTLVEVAGLARSDTGNFPEEFQAIAERLRAALHTDHAAFPVATVGAGKD